MRLGEQLRLGSQKSRQRLLDFAWLGEAAGALFRIQVLAVESDLESTVPALYQFGCLTEVLLYLVRQTGGLRFVVSNYAVFDRDPRHRCPPGSEYTDSGRWMRYP